jgi:hypothetical protein
MKYNYNKEKHSLKGISEMEKPDRNDKKYCNANLTFNYDLYNCDYDIYHDHVNSLPEYPLPKDTPAPEWWGEVLEENVHFKLSMKEEKLREGMYTYDPKIKEAIPLPEPQKQEPPLGLMPEWRDKELRCLDIDNAIERYIKANKELPQEWIDEKFELQKWLSNRKNPNQEKQEESETWEFTENELIELLCKFHNQDSHAKPFIKSYLTRKR